MGILGYFERNRVVAVLLILVLLAAIAWVDHVTGFELSFSVFYLFPVSFAAWALGERGGLAVSLVSAILWMLMDMTSGHVYSNPHIVYWNATVRLVFFGLTGFSVARLRAASIKENKLSRLKSEMVSLVSHEVNNALVSLNLASALLQEEEAGDITENRKKFYAVIDQTHHRLSQMVKSFLAKARLESGRLVPEMQRVELRNMAWEAISTLALMSGEKGVAVDTDFPADVIPVRSDPEFISLVINNLVLNAIKYTPPGGSVRVRLEERGEGLVRMSVVDTGVGIKPADLENIFSGYYRTEEGKKMSKGTGIGLSASHDLLSLLGARLTVESEPGRGSNFYFELPAWKET